jgi:PIN domain nuclease of toxin-antitoxin system
MKILFDTHAFIWWRSDPDRLPQDVLEACHHLNNELLVSVVSIWEMQIKSQIGKLELDEPLAEILASEQALNHITVLPIESYHIYELDALPLHHRDPFDRLLVAQARTENAILLTNDQKLRGYDVPLIWD